MTSVKITSKGDEAVQAEIKRLAARVGSPRPILGAIGEILVDSTTKRFASGVGPDGKKWKRNAPSTIARYLAAFGNSRRRQGTKRPLIGETLALSTTISWNVSGRTLSVGSPMIYAGVQHVGARRGEFGATRRGSPIPWGDIPARPFLGLTAEDREDILDSLREMLDR